MVKRIVCIIQARMNSKRLPGKVMMNIEGSPLIYWVIKSVINIKLYDQIVIAIPKIFKKNNKIVDYVKKFFPKVVFYRGSNEDVLDRYYKAAKKFNAKIITRITADDPLKDSNIIKKSLKFFLKSNLDYYSNTLINSFPTGLDVEHFTFKTLKKIKLLAVTNYDKEHVTSYIKSNQKKFKCQNFLNRENLSRIRLTVDTKKDLNVIRKIFKIKKKSKKNFLINIKPLFDKKKYEN